MTPNERKKRYGIGCAFVGRNLGGYRWAHAGHTGSDHVQFLICQFRIRQARYIDGNQTDERQFRDREDIGISDSHRQQLCGVRQNRVAPADVATVISVVYQSLVALGKDTKPVQSPAVSVRQSVRPS